MSILYVLPHYIDCDKLTQRLRLVDTKADTIILINDAVYLAHNDRYGIFLSPYQVVVSIEDCSARHIKTQCTKIEYADFVQLSLLHQGVITW